MTRIIEYLNEQKADCWNCLATIGFNFPEHARYQTGDWEIQCPNCNNFISVEDETDYDLKIGIKNDR